MKNYLILFCLFCISCILSSCTEPLPNDRAIFNLQGNVKTVEMRKANSKGKETVVFTENGMISKNKGSMSYLGSYKGVKKFRHLECVYDNGKRTDTFIYDFDRKGRLEIVTYKNSVDSIITEIEYEYDGANILPLYKTEKRSVLGGKKEIVAEGEIIYASVDEIGNWTESSWNGEVIKRNITYYDAPLLVPNCPTTREIDWNKLLDMLLGILLISALLFAVIHMIYILLIKKKLITDYSATVFENYRMEKGLLVATASDNQLVANILNSMLDLWTDVDGNGGLYPMSIKAIRQSEAAIANIVTIAPSDSELIDNINECSKILNGATTRHFDGSKTFIVVAMILSLVLSLIAGSMNLLILVSCSSVIYVLASLCPEFMIRRKILKGKGNRPSTMSNLFGSLFGMIAAAKTYETITTWSDGSRTKSTDDSETWISLAITFAVALFLSVFMSFIAFVNYLRNYVIYR